MKLLVVEDEPKLNEGLVEGLRAEGFVVESVFDGEEAERVASVESYDAIVLDVMLPKRDGFEVCQNLRAKGIQTPILFLTARGTVPDKVSGLNLGADDYLAKPFSFDELTARIRSLLRRPVQLQPEILIWHDLQLDTASQQVAISGRPITLTLREYHLLEYLIRHKDQVVTREDILSHVWDRFFDSFSNVVDVHVKNLRKKLPEIYEKRIETIWGKGYRLS